MVIRYSYLWLSEFLRGQEEGVKDRPCAVLLALADENGEQRVTVLPITHTPPSESDHAVEIPPATKLRLGLDHERSWIVLTESNRFIWPGPDLRPATRGDASSVAFGLLPRALFTEVRDKWLALRATRASRVVARTE
nr:hypothetical protein [Rhodoblastus acidophilus]